MVVEHSNVVPPPFILTKMDVERLIHDQSEDSRIDILHRVAENYNQGAFAQREHAIAEQLFRMLMKDAIVYVRETLAERLKNNPTVPRDIVMHMAHDVQSVSIPLLLESKALSDADLVSIVEASVDMIKLTTIAKREGISERVGNALVETHYPEVVSTLMTNETAEVTPRMFEKVMEDFRGDSSVMEALVNRSNLPITVVEKLVMQASDALVKQLKDKYQLTDSQIGKDASGAREDVLIRILGHDVPDAEVEALVTQLSNQNRLTPSLVMMALCRGQLTFFIMSLARFAAVPALNAKRLVNDRGGNGFRAIYQKAELPPAMYDAVHLLLRTSQQMHDGEAIPGSLIYANELVERLLKAAGDKNIDYLPYFIALIRQNIQRH